MRKLSAVLFDLDGTLMDTPLAIAQVVRSVLASLGRGDVPPDRVKSLVGVPLGPLFAELLEVDATSHDVMRAIDEYRRLYALHVTPRARELLYPGVVEGLTCLAQAGLRLTVATNKIRPVADAMLEAGGILDFFEEVVGADMVPVPKPDPAMGLLVAERLGLPAQACVMVGDTVHDVHMAHGAGMPCVAITHGAHDLTVLHAANPAYIAASFPEAVEHVLTMFRAQD